MATDSKNALLTYEEICNLYHFCQFTGKISGTTANPILVDNSYNTNWNGTEYCGTASYGFFFIKFNNSVYLFGYSSPVCIYGKMSECVYHPINFIDSSGISQNATLGFIFEWSIPALGIYSFDIFNDHGEPISFKQYLENSEIIGFLNMSEQM